ncbi:hypothetical protein SSX86_017399 [Deinandra increscens subsp. villosa]|uniref:Retrovirus-related Pol polyprotein from transposon TNT 1-94-like beta-barrel domain-containing protein n=1 Tax=Deinandra increscens subsp. villosa TaxID=3103831 RepID=A0AAP0CV71_9ASTR
MSTFGSTTAATASSTITSIVSITAPTHLPIKLTSLNFPVWRRHIESTLIGLSLDGYLTGRTPVPSKTLPGNKANPEYDFWYRQDQIIFGALLGSCSDDIQPLIASAATAKDAWDRLNSSYASTSCSRIISLKSKLAKNPKGNRSISEFLNEMRSIADELALVQRPVQDEDLLVYILSQLGDEYNSITAALKVRDQPITYPELYDKLVDFERSLKEAELVVPTVIPTANAAQRYQRYSTAQQGRSDQPGPNRSMRTTSSPSSYSRPNRTSAGPASNSGSKFTPRNPNVFCNFCNIAGHETKDCRKLRKFINDNQVALQPPVASPTANTATTGPSHNMWMLDSGASHHLTPTPANLPSVSEYGGPDEIYLGDGTGLSISHTGHTSFPTNSKSLHATDVLCVPHIKSNLLSVAKLCKTNGVSVEFFPSFFHVKDLNASPSSHRRDRAFPPSLCGLTSHLLVTRLSNCRIPHQSSTHSHLIHRFPLSNPLPTTPQLHETEDLWVFMLPMAPAIYYL